MLQYQEHCLRPFVPQAHPNKLSKMMFYIFFGQTTFVLKIALFSAKSRPSEKERKLLFCINSIKIRKCTYIQCKVFLQAITVNIGL